MKGHIMWREELKYNIRTLADLKKYIYIAPALEEQLTKVLKIHPLSITRYYIRLAKKYPVLLKMFIPDVAELDTDGSYDASNESANTKGHGIQHKYRQTVLFLVTNRCTAFCRYCFRKRFFVNPHDKQAAIQRNKEIANNIDNLIAYVKKHPSVDNILFTGGDSLFIPTNLIEKFLKKVFTIKHIKYIRFGTKVLAVYPDRILKDPKLIEIFKKYANRGKKIYVIAHFCHPDEITPTTIKAVKILQSAGVELLNQAVLLKGVNDDAKILGKLFNKLIAIDILPYYLFQCRPVKRIKNHFQVPLARGYEIFTKAKAMAKGHLLCKRIKFVMSHTEGKIEILYASKKDKQIILKFHQPKNKGKDSERVVTLPYDDKITWAPENI